jgi:hypothetical protein
MNYLENKKKKFFKTLRFSSFALGMLGFLLISTQANAQDSTPTETTPTTYQCEDLGRPDKLKGKIVTIIEEPIGNPTENKPTIEPGKEDPVIVINCFRKSVCETDENNRKTCEPPVFATICSNDGDDICQPIQAYLARSGANLLYSYVGNIYRWAAGMIGIVTVLYLVVGGVEIATAGGDQGKIDKAKERIMQSITGLVLLFLSALILYTINPNFFTL